MTNIQLWQNRSFVLKDVRLRRGIPDNLTRKKMAVRWNLPQQKISGLLLQICWKLAEVVDDDRQLATGAAERPILSRIDAAGSYWYVFDNRHFQSLSYRKSAQITRSGAHAVRNGLTPPCLYCTIWHHPTNFLHLQASSFKLQGGTVVPCVVPTLSPLSDSSPLDSQPKTCFPTVWYFPTKTSHYFIYINRESKNYYSVIRIL